MPDMDEHNRNLSDSEQIPDWSKYEKSIGCI